MGMNVNKSMKTKPGKIHKPIMFLTLAAGVVLLIMGIIGPGLGIAESISSFIKGMGTGIVFSIVLWLYIAMLRPNIIDQNEVTAKDERLIHIRERAALTASIVFLFAVFIGVTLSIFLDAYFTAIILTVVMLVQMLAYLIFRRFYAGRM